MPERIVETASKLFYRHGIRATGVDRIADEVGITKRTLYYHFATKDELVAAYLSHAAPSPPAAAESDGAPADRILGAFERLEDWFKSADFRGCPFVNAVAELGDPEHPAGRVAAAAKERRRLWFRDLLVQAGVAAADETAMQLLILFDGVIATALVRRDHRVARSACAMARVLLEATGVALEAATPKRRPRTLARRGRVIPRRRSTLAG